MSASTFAEPTVREIHHDRPNTAPVPAVPPDDPLAPANDGSPTGGSPSARARAAERPGSVLLWGALLGGAALLALGRRRGATTAPAVDGHDGAPRPPGQAVRTRAARQLDAGAATIAFSVLADSALEHYRAGFYNPVMYVAPLSSAVTLGSAVSAALRPGKGGPARTAIFAAAAVTGLVGFSFHLTNITRREGGWSWNSLFYGAPVAAPLGIHLAGLLGLAAARVAGARGLTAPRLLGMPAGRVLALGAAAGLVGTAAEAGLLHFRGAYHNRYMWLPVTLPPAAALALVVAALAGGATARGGARALLGATTLLGGLGVGFHAYGVSRNMGGWRNWTQNIQNGPPLPAPPSFTGLALAGLGALDLLDAEAHT